MVVVMTPPGDIPFGEDALYCGPVRRGAIREQSTPFSSIALFLAETAAAELDLI